MLDLFNDLRDGSRLLDLLEVMSGQRMVSVLSHSSVVQQQIGVSEHGSSCCIDVTLDHKSSHTVSSTSIFVDIAKLYGVHFEWVFL